MNLARSVLARAAVCAALLVHAGPPASGAERYRLVSAEEAQALERRLQTAGNDGFRILAATQTLALSGKIRFVVLLERRPDSADRCEYAVLEAPGSFDDSSSGTSINSLGAQGFRIRPGSALDRQVSDWFLAPEAYDEQVTLIMEKTGTLEEYRYVALKYDTAQSFSEDVARHGKEGYEVLGMWNSGRRLRILMERHSPADRPVRVTEDSPAEYRVLIGAVKAGMRGQVAGAASAGFRVVDVTDQTIKAPPMFLMKRPAGRSEAFRYKLMYKPGKKIDRSKIEKKLNRRGRKGFRVVQEGITPTVVTLERPLGPKVSRAYRTLSSRAGEPVTEALEAAIEQGYRFLALLAYADETVVVVEISPAVDSY